MANRILLSALFNQDSPFDSVVSEKWYGGLGLLDAGEDKKAQRILVVWGGEDISPSIYNQAANTKVFASANPSKRDMIETELVREAYKNKIPMIGVCRGAQLMCALFGGKLVQHITGHHQDHPIDTDMGKTFTTSSIHHQMMIPDGLPNKLIAWSSPRRSSTYLGEKDLEIETCHANGWKEPEIVWFPEHNALCIQGHPEYMNHSDPFNKYVLELVEQYIFPIKHPSMEENVSA